MRYVILNSKMSSPRRRPIRTKNNHAFTDKNETMARFVGNTNESALARWKGISAINPKISTALMMDNAFWLEKPPLDPSKYRVMNEPISKVDRARSISPLVGSHPGKSRRRVERQMRYMRKMPKRLAISISIF